MKFQVQDHLSTDLSFIPWVGMHDYWLSLTRDRDPRPAAHADSDTRTDPQIPQSVSPVG